MPDAIIAGRAPLYAELSRSFDQGDSVRSAALVGGLRPKEAYLPRRAGHQRTMIGQASRQHHDARVAIFLGLSVSQSRPARQGRWGELRQGHGAKLTVWQASARARTWCLRCRFPGPGARRLMPAQL